MQPVTMNKPSGFLHAASKLLVRGVCALHDGVRAYPYNFLVATPVVLIGGAALHGGLMYGAKGAGAYSFGAAAFMLFSGVCLLNYMSNLGGFFARKAWPSTEGTREEREEAYKALRTAQKAAITQALDAGEYKQALRLQFASKPPLTKDMALCLCGEWCNYG